jgi:hypothetical protein
MGEMTVETGVAVLGKSVLLWGKWALKYGVVLAYLWVVFRKVETYMRSRKLKKV